MFGVGGTVWLIVIATMFYVIRELCKHADGTAEVHHVRKLADLDRPGRPQPAWDQLMAKRRRKTLIVCADCHAAIHGGRPTATATQ